VCECLVLAGCVDREERRYGRAIRLLAAVTAYYQARGAAPFALGGYVEYIPPEFIPPLYEHCLAALHAEVDGASYDREWAAGRQMSLQQAVAEALVVLAACGGAQSAAPPTHGCRP
jgi:hypothetical protein